MDELKTYLEKMEGRIDELYSKSPKTNLHSEKFMTRAFAVWGHNFVANLVIGAIMGAILTIIYGCMATSILSTVIKSTSRPTMPPPCYTDFLGRSSCTPTPGK
jgi:hypothetical protein